MTASNMPPADQVRATALILALVKRVNEEPNEETGEPQKLSDADRDKMIKTIKNLLRVAFDPAVTAAERQAFLEKALRLSAKFCIGWGDLEDAPPPDWAPPSDSHPPGPGRTASCCRTRATRWRSPGSWSANGWTRTGT